MAALPRLTGWILDPTSQHQYCYDSQTDQVVWDNGARTPRPRHVDAAAYYTAAAAAAARESQTSPANTGAGNTSGITVPGSSAEQHNRAHVGNFTQYRPGAAQLFTYNQASAARGVRRASQSGLPQLNQGFAGLNLDSAMTAQPAQFQPSVTRGPHGESIFEVVDDAKVTNFFIKDPPERTTDPALLKVGVKAYRRVFGPSDVREGDAENLYPDFKVRPSSFFALGKVFSVLWVEPAGSTVITTFQKPNPSISKGRFNENVFSKVRRFVVVREGAAYCSALPIASYGHQGVGKRFVVKSEHAIIHTSKTAPVPLPDETPGRDEPGMRSQPIRVVPDNPTDKLDDESRIDFGKVHTIHHNIKVKAFGMVHPKFMAALTSQWFNVWQNIPDSMDSGIVMPGSSTGVSSSGAPAPLQGARRSTVGSQGTTDSSNSGRGISKGKANVPSVAPNASKKQAPVPPQSETTATGEAAEQAARQVAEQAQRFRAVISKRMQEGMTREQAVESLIQSILERGYTRKTAMQLIRSRLSSNSQPSVAGGAEDDGDEDEGEDGDEDENAQAEASEESGDDDDEADSEESGDDDEEADNDDGKPTSRH